MSTANPSALPELIGPYRIGKKLGVGGMGAVYLAQDTRLNRPVALKVALAADKPQALARFRREAQAAALLRHPNFCPVYDVGAQDGLHYLVMAYIEGTGLAEWRGNQREAAGLLLRDRRTRHRPWHPHSPGDYQRRDCYGSPDPLSCLTAPGCGPRSAPRRLLRPRTPAAATPAPPVAIPSPPESEASRADPRVSAGE